MRHSNSPNSPAIARAGCSERGGDLRHVARFKTAQNRTAARLQDPHPLRREIGNPCRADIRHHDVGKTCRNFGSREPSDSTETSTPAFSKFSRATATASGIVVVSNYRNRLWSFTAASARIPGARADIHHGHAGFQVPLDGFRRTKPRGLVRAGSERQARISPRCGCAPRSASESFRHIPGTRKCADRFPSASDTRARMPPSRACRPLRSLPPKRDCTFRGARIVIEKGAQSRVQVNSSSDARQIPLPGKARRPENPSLFCSAVSSGGRKLTRRFPEHSFG